MRAMVAVDAAGGQLVKFGRWFSAYNYAEQATLAGSYGRLHASEGTYLGQDIQVFVLGPADPHEQNNLATTLPDSEITSLSESLNALMAAELSGPGLTPRETQSFIKLWPESKAAAAAPGAVDQRTA